MPKAPQTETRAPVMVGAAGLECTRHGMTQMQRRSIPPVIVSWLSLFGATVRRHGAEVCYLDKRARKELRKQLGTKIYSRIEDQLDIYLVVSDQEDLITAAHRRKRLKS